MSNDAAGIVARFHENFESFLRLQRTQCPEALYFGPRVAVRLAVEAVRVAGADSRFTPAFMTADAMLYRGGHSDYAAEIRARHGPMSRRTEAHRKSEVADAWASELNSPRKLRKNARFHFTEASWARFGRPVVAACQRSAQQYRVLKVKAVELIYRDVWQVAVRPRRRDGPRRRE